MGNRAKLALVVVAGIAVGVVVVRKLAPDRRSAEQQILAALVEIEKAVEDKNVRACMKHVSEAYSDSQVENKRELTRLAISGCREPGQFQVLLQPKPPRVHGSQATVQVRVDFSVVRGDVVQRVDPFTVQTWWIKEKGKWRIVRAEGYMQAESGLSGAYR